MMLRCTSNQYASDTEMRITSQRFFATVFKRIHVRGAVSLNEDEITGFKLLVKH
jgi:hypothetical protein